MTHRSDRHLVESAGFATFLRATYGQSLKSARSDEWINTFLIRPLASGLVWFFYRLRLAPWHVVLLGTVSGTLCAPALLFGPPGKGTVWAGGFLLAKNLLDAADGQLARATNRVDRIGRFADSISDFWVNALLCLSTAMMLVPRWGWAGSLVLGASAGLLLILQCSLFVFYQVSYLGLVRHNPANRLDERPTEEEARAPSLERRLQAVYLALYGWQDRGMAALDRVLFGRALGSAGERDPRGERLWYGDVLGLRLTSFLGLGTSLTIYGALLLLGRPGMALAWTIAGQTSIAAIAILYRWLVLGPRVRRWLRANP